MTRVRGRGSVFGGIPLCLGIVPDDLDEIKNILNDALHAGIYPGLFHGVQVTGVNPLPWGMISRYTMPTAARSRG